MHWVLVHWHWAGIIVALYFVIGVTVGIIKHGRGNCGDPRCRRCNGPWFTWQGWSATKAASYTPSRASHQLLCRCPAWRRGARAPSAP